MYSTISRCLFRMSLTEGPFHGRWRGGGDDTLFEPVSHRTNQGERIYGRQF